MSGEVGLGRMIGGMIAGMICGMTDEFIVIVIMIVIVIVTFILTVVIFLFKMTPFPNPQQYTCNFPKYSQQHQSY